MKYGLPVAGRWTIFSGEFNADDENRSGNSDSIRKTSSGPRSPREKGSLTRALLRNVFVCSKEEFIFLLEPISLN
jgi:hypothetical protein